MPATLDRDVLPRRGVFTCRGSREVIAGREEGQTDGVENGWAKRAKDRLETVQVDGQVRQSADRWRVVDGQASRLSSELSQELRSPGLYSLGGSEAANRVAGLATPLPGPAPPPSPAGPKAWGCQEGWGRRLAALLLLTAPSSLSQNSLSSLPTASPSHPQLLHFQKRTIEASGGQHEIMHLKSPACGWHIVGTKEAKHCGIGYYHHSHLTDGEAEAQIVRTVSWPLNPAV